MIVATTIMNLTGQTVASGHDRDSRDDIAAVWGIVGDATEAYINVTMTDKAFGEEFAAAVARKAHRAIFDLPENEVLISETTESGRFIVRRTYWSK